jgi:hypothetical protein
LAELALVEDKWLMRNKALIKQRCQDKAARAKAVADEFTKQRCHAAAAQTAALAELVLAKERCCHDAAMQMAMSAASSFANERHRHKAAAQAAELAVLLLAEERRQHEAIELATMSAMRSLAALQDRVDMEAIAYEAPALPTTTLPEPLAMLSPSPCPTSPYLGAFPNTNGGGHLLLHSTLPTMAAPTSLSIIKDQPLWIRHRA